MLPENLYQNTCSILFAVYWQYLHIQSSQQKWIAVHIIQHIYYNIMVCSQYHLVWAWRWRVVWFQMKPINPLNYLVSFQLFQLIEPFT